MSDSGHSLDEVQVRPLALSDASDRVAFYREPALARFENFSGFWSTSVHEHFHFHELGHEALARSIYSINELIPGVSERTDLFTMELARSQHNRTWTTIKLENEITSEEAVHILSEVSRHALVSPAELVAEVFAGLIAGQTYSENVMEVYIRFAGIVPSDRGRIGSASDFHQAEKIEPDDETLNSFSTAHEHSQSTKGDIQRQVSVQACRSLEDFVSEVFAGLVAGREFSDEVMQLYESLGGTEF